MPSRVNENAMRKHDCPMDEGRMVARYLDTSDFTTPKTEPQLGFDDVLFRAGTIPPNPRRTSFCSGPLVRTLALRTDAAPEIAWRWFESRRRPRSLPRRDGSSTETVRRTESTERYRRSTSVTDQLGRGRTRDFMDNERGGVLVLSPVCRARVRKNLWPGGKQADCNLAQAPSAISREVKPARRGGLGRKSRHIGVT